MASQSLYRKWRSQTFDDLVGQEPVIRTLKNALTSDKLAHAYIFTGPRGTGKTSTARLLAKTINCPNAKDGEPCNVCEQCREITLGNSFNVVEIDAASNRGIDSIRELRDKVMMPPTVGKYKVYILDEAHMLTTEAFNALLKTLEEPPPHAIFVMATTDVHKMLPTVLSRCQRFDFKRITTQQIVNHLQFVAHAEQVKLETGAALLIARAAAGGMRDALSLLDQAIAYAGNEIVLSQVQAMLGVADPRAIQKFVQHIAELDSAGGLHLIHELTEAGADLRQINSQVAEYWRAMMLASAGANIAEILDQTDAEMADVKQLCRLFVLDELTECARIFAQNELMQKNQGTPQLGLELALLACISLHRRTGQPVAAAAGAGVPVAVPSRPVPSPSQERSPVAPVQPAVPQPRPAAIEMSPKQPVAAPDKAAPPVAPEPISVEPDWDDISYADDLDAEEPFVPTISQPAVASPQTSPVAEQRAVYASVEPAMPEFVEAPVTEGVTLTVEDVKEKWEYVLKRVGTRKDGGKVSALLKGYTIAGVESTKDVPVILIRANMKFHYDTLQNANQHHESIEWALKIVYERECRVRLLPPGQNLPGQSAVIPPMPVAGDMSKNVAHNRIAAPVAPSAHRERPPQPAPEQSSAPPAPKQKAAPISAAPSAPAAPRSVQAPPTAVAPARVEHIQAVPLARTQVVSENTKQMPPATAPDGTRLATVRQKAKEDRVVQEVVRMFKVKIDDQNIQFK